MPIVDAVGRLLHGGAEVVFRRHTAERLRVTTMGGRVIFLFDYCDTTAPQIEVETRVGIVTETAARVGNCWKFEGLLVNGGTPVPRFNK